MEGWEGKEKKEEGEGEHNTADDENDDGNDDGNINSCFSLCPLIETISFLICKMIKVILYTPHRVVVIRTKWDSAYKAQAPMAGICRKLSKVIAIISL